MKLVFYSGGEAKDNKLLDKELIRIIAKKDPLVSFIPASSYHGAHDFRDFVDQYKKFGIRKFLYFPVDVPFDKVMLEVVFKSDLIYMGGGNTFSFLKDLRAKKLLPKLKDFVSQGKVLAGLSAGAIMMTKDITTAGYPSFDRDENAVKLVNLRSIGLVQFDFFPHYRSTTRYDLEFKKLCTKTNRPILACPDGAGIVIEGQSMMFVGACHLFIDGIKTNLTKSFKQSIIL